jgi:hypothetical protein
MARAPDIAAESGTVGAVAKDDAASDVDAPATGAPASSSRVGATAYDAAYIALAEALAAVLVTRDKALARIPGRRAVVEIF